jgi:hypothetical protein
LRVCTVRVELKYLFVKLVLVPTTLMSIGGGL